jgi:hypothetical protein
MLHVTQNAAINMVQPLNRLAALNRDLVAWWLCLPGATGGSRWVDIANPVGLSLTGTLTNMDPASDWIKSAGRPGGWAALDFDGSNDTVALGTAPTLDILGDITVCCWIKTTLSSTYKEIIDCAVNGTFRGWAFGMGPTTGCLGWWQLGQGGGDWVAGTVTYNNGQWRHIAAVHQASAVSFYVDGKFDVSASSPLQRIAGAANKTIGGNVLSATRYHSGQIDSLKVYKRGLTAREIELEISQSKLGYPHELNRVQRLVVPSLASAGNRRRRAIICGAA